MTIRMPGFGLGPGFTTSQPLKSRHATSANTAAANWSRVTCHAHRVHSTQGRLQ